MCDSIVVSTVHGDAPWVTADLAVLNEAAAHVLFDVDLQFLTAIRAGDAEGVEAVHVLIV